MLNTRAFFKNSLPNLLDSKAFFNIKHFENYKTLQIAFDKIQEGHDEYAAKASGLLNKMEEFDLFLG